MSLYEGVELCTRERMAYRDWIAICTVGAELFVEVWGSGLASREAVEVRGKEP